MRILAATSTSIPHAELMKSVARRVVDGAMLHLIKMWLEAPVEETDERGSKHRSTRNRDEGRGTPQGAPISPLLSNLYMRRFVLGWKTAGARASVWKAYIVNYADDLVICCRGSAEEALAAMRGMMTKLKLTVNEAKTRVCQLPEEKFDFLGYTFGRCYSPKTGRAYLGTVPSKKRVIRICRGDQRRDRTAIKPCWIRGRVVAKLNRMMIGLGELLLPGAGQQSLPGGGATRPEEAASVAVRQAQSVRAGDQADFRKRLCTMSWVWSGLPTRTRSFPWATRVSLSPRAGCGKSACPVR